jgi:hypothetical protein
MAANRPEKGLVFRRKVLVGISDGADQTKASADQIVEQPPRALARDRSNESIWPVGPYPMIATSQTISFMVMLSSLRSSFF